MPVSEFNFFPVINDDGTVAFSASLDDGTVGVFSVSDGLFTTIASRPGALGILRSPTINTDGTVAFAGQPVSFGPVGVFTGTGGPLTTIADKLQTLQEVSAHGLTTQLREFDNHLGIATKKLGTAVDELGEVLEDAATTITSGAQPQ